VKYRLARRLSETPPPNLIVRRPAPEEKAALMLAKLRTPGIKSPDADVLLIEQAREFLQIQPPSVRTLYVTGDQAHARSAVAVLPPQNVLYAPPANLDVKAPVLGMAAFWHPASGFGAVRVLSLGEIVWHLLAAVDHVTLIGTAKEIEVHHLLHDSGAPSDWIDPRMCVEERAVNILVGTGQSGRALAATPVPTSNSHTRPIMPATLRPSPATIRSYLNSALAGSTISPPNEELPRESFRLLVQLGVIDNSGAPLADSSFLAAIRANDWDQIHTNLLRSGAYANAINELRRMPGMRATGRVLAQISFARRLGQVAKPERDGPNMVGDRRIGNEELVAFLNSVLEVPGTDYAVAEVCKRALTELGVTPARLEDALRKLLDSGYTEVSLETGGSVGKGASEEVFRYNGSDVIETTVSTAALKFGGERPIKSLRRRV
jgi:hypothetical protein